MWVSVFSHSGRALRVAMYPFVCAYFPGQTKAVNATLRQIWVKPRHFISLVGQLPECRVAHGPSIPAHGHSKGRFTSSPVLDRLLALSKTFVRA